MKPRIRVLFPASAFALMLFFSGSVLAQDPVVLTAGPFPVSADFYDEDGELVVEDYELDTSPIGKRIEDIDEADEVEIQFGDTTLTFDITSAGSKNSILVLLDDGEEMTLSEVMDELEAVAAGEKEVELLFDDGVVTSFVTRRARPAAG